MTAKVFDTLMSHDAKHMLCTHGGWKRRKKNRIGIEIVSPLEMLSS